MGLSYVGSTFWSFWDIISKGAFTYAEKCQIGQQFTAVEGAGKGWLGPGGRDVIQGDSTHRNKTMQSERNLKATRSDASKLSSVLDKIISHSACGRYDDSYLLSISWNNALLRQHTHISRPQIYAHQSYRSFCRSFYWCKFGLFNSLV